jgi:hypothetical protein
VTAIRGDHLRLVPVEAGDDRRLHAEQIGALARHRRHDPVGADAAGHLHRDPADRRLLLGRRALHLPEPRQLLGVAVTRGHVDHHAPQPDHPAGPVPHQADDVADHDVPAAGRDRPVLEVVVAARRRLRQAVTDGVRAVVRVDEARPERHPLPRGHREAEHPLRVVGDEGEPVGGRVVGPDDRVQVLDQAEEVEAVQGGRTTAGRPDVERVRLHRGRSPRVGRERLHSGSTADADRLTR